MAYTQEGKLISVSTPLGEDTLLLQGLSGVEGISRLFSFHLELLSENDSISFTDIVGQNVTISVELADGRERYFNGYVSRFVRAGRTIGLPTTTPRSSPGFGFLPATRTAAFFRT